MKCSILSAGPLLSARTWCRRASFSYYSSPTCIVKIISHHSGPLIPPALGEPQQGQTEAELEHDGDTGRLEQHRTQSLSHWLVGTPAVFQSVHCNW